MRIQKFFMKNVLLNHAAWIALAIIHLFPSAISAFPFVLPKVESQYVDEELATFWSSVKDINNPTGEDFLRFQDYLKHGKRPYLDLLFDPLIACGRFTPEEPKNREYFICNRMLQRMEFLGPDGKPGRLQVHALNVRSTDKSRCIIVFSSYNQPPHSKWGKPPKYNDMVPRLLEELNNVGYKGHVLARVGGYPMMEKGGICLAHVPYSFKVLAFIEASQMGYEEVLWIDLSMHPTNDLSAVFDTIRQKGALLLGTGASLELATQQKLPILPSAALKNVRVSVAELGGISHIIAGIIGVSFRDPRTHQLIAEWYRMTAETLPAMTMYPEQFLLTVACWRIFGRETEWIWNYFDPRSTSDYLPGQSTKPFWLDKG